MQRTVMFSGLVGVVVAAMQAWETRLAAAEATPPAAASAGRAAERPRFVDHGDGTITDTTTGLMWEQKTAAPGLHAVANVYTWTVTGGGPNGTVFTTFLAQLNNCTSADGQTVAGGFAGHCDWRLPTVHELRTITLQPCNESACFEPALGPVAEGPYWTSTTHATIWTYAWYVLGAEAFACNQSFFHHARAVRSAR